MRSLLVPRDIIDFCMLILYPVSLLNPFFNSRGFFKKKFGRPLDIFQVDNHIRQYRQQRRSHVGEMPLSARQDERQAKPPVGDMQTHTRFF